MKKRIIIASFVFMALACISCRKTPELDLVAIRDDDGSYKMVLRTEVTQGLYKKVMNCNPSYFQPGSVLYEEENGKPYEITDGENPDNLPVDSVSYWDAVIFCNKLSRMHGLEPFYGISFNNRGEPVYDVNPSIYIPNTECNSYHSHSYDYRQKTAFSAYRRNGVGYRLLTADEWKRFSNKDEVYKYSGSDDLNEVGWYKNNSGNKSHEVALKKQNSYGLNDMSGNVWELCDGNISGDRRKSHWVSILGSGYESEEQFSDVNYEERMPDSSLQFKFVGFRIIRDLPSKEYEKMKAKGLVD